MSHSMYTHKRSGNKATILLRVLSDITKFHIQYIFWCHVIAVCACMYGGRYIHTYVVLYVYTNGMHILETLPLVLLFFTSFILASLAIWWGGLGGGGKDWKSSCFFLSPLCRSGSGSRAMLGPPTHTCEPSSNHHSLSASTQTRTHKHVRTLCCA